MTTQPEQFDLDSHHIAEDKQQELLRLFPEARTEGGKIDFERLKLALGETVDVGKERYGMNWPGKAECFKTIQQPSMATLRPAPEESVNFDTTENLIIEGDNLEVLKLLQKSYLGKVKMIYIDPPYNTGNDFIYPDNYTESLQTYLEYTGQVDAEGRKFGNNNDTDGRFHSKWMNMMYPRLYLARNLLRADGVIFISVDDTEVDNLKKICNEVFGEDNFLTQIVWKSRYNAAKEKHLAQVHEYILFYARNKDEIESIYLPTNEEYLNRYFKNQDEKYELRGPYRLQPLEAGRSMDSRANLVYPIPGPNGRDIYPKRQWKWEKTRSLKALEKGELEFTKAADGSWSISTKQYLKDESGDEYGIKGFSLIDNIYNQEGTKEIEGLFGSVKYFPFPKPTALITHLINIAGVKNDDLILDFFPGSGTTAHAIIALNRQDGNKRKFLLIQLPEPCDKETEAFQSGCSTIVEITKERVRRVIKKLNDQDAGKLDLDGGRKQDRGFRVFKLADSNFKTWNAHGAQDTASLEKQLELHIDHIKEARSIDDLLYELLLKSGFPLTTPVEPLTLAGKTVHSVAGGMMFICLEKDITIELIRAMADRKPERVVCLDAGFAGNDQLKANAVQIFKTKEIKKFETV